MRPARMDFPFAVMWTLNPDWSRFRQRNAWPKPRIMQQDKLSARDVRFGKVALSTKARNFDRSLA
jgi:hypothetical protein